MSSELQPAFMDEDDEVVNEIDVYICNEFKGSQTSLCLLQHPLRPPWRPYDYEQVKKIRMKPSVKRMEVDVPIDEESSNYNEDVDDFKRVDKVTLRSQLVESKTTQAIGTIKDGKLLLAPLDFAMQLRPSLNFLNVSRVEKKGKAGEESEEEEDAQMHVIEVQVQKRETERQQQARLNSFAYLSQKEEEEAFVEMDLHLADSATAEKVWERFMTPKDVDPFQRLERQDYLSTIVPATANKSVGDQLPLPKP